MTTAAEKAGVTDTGMIDYYNKMVKGKTEEAAIQVIKNKEAARVINEAATADLEKIEAARIIRILSEYKEATN